MFAMKHRDVFNIKRFALTLSLVACACALAACGPHQVIDRGEDCTSCHEGADFDKDSLVFDVENPQPAAKTDAFVTVKTNASEVIVCRPTFIAEDGSKFVPERDKSVKVSDGSATIELGEGCWALCIDHGDSADGVIVVSAGLPSSEESAIQVEL